MHTQETADYQRRRFLVAAATLVGGVGVISASLPFIASMRPSARAQSAGEPVTVDVSKLEPGQQITVEWRGKPVWLLRRTARMLERLQAPKQLTLLRDPKSRVVAQQPPYAQNAFRSLEAEYFVVVGICTHLGCVPTYRPAVAPPDLGADWMGGYFCPCHGSRFDLAGRVFKDVPAPTNLVVPPYRYLGNTVIQVGVGPETT